MEILVKVITEVDMRKSRALRFSLRALLTVAVFGIAQAQVEGPAPRPLIERDGAFVLRPEKPSGESRFRVTESTERLELLVISTDVEVDVTIVGPDGATINAANISERGGTFKQTSTSPDEKGGGFVFSFPAGHYYAFHLPNPEAGEYLIHASARGEVTKPSQVLALAHSGDSAKPVEHAPDLEYRVHPVGGTFQAGIPMRLTCSVRSRALAVRDAEAVATIHGPGPETVLPLRDDGVAPDSKAGDGIYSATYEPQTPGDHAVNTVVTAPLGGDRVKTEQQWWGFNVVPVMARLTGTVDTAGVDTDQDGLFDHLAIDTEVDVREAGEYSVRAIIEREVPVKNRPVAGDRVQAHLSAGTHHLTVLVAIVSALPENADLFIQKGDRSHNVLPLDGRHKIERIELWREDPPNKRREIQTLFDTGMTPEIPAALIEPPYITLTRPVSDRAVDDDGDGEFDALILSFPIRLAKDVVVEQWVAGLKDPSMHRWEQGPVTDSDTALEVRLPGIKIAAGELDGPYTITHASITTSKGRFQITRPGKTGAYRASQFHRAEPRILSIRPAQGSPGEYVPDVSIELHDVLIERNYPKVEIDRAYTGATKSTNAGSLTTSITIPRDAELGPRDVKVTIGKQVVTLPNGFTVVAPPSQP